MKYRTTIAALITILTLSLLPSLSYSETLVITQPGGSVGGEECPDGVIVEITGESASVSCASGDYTGVSGGNFVEETCNEGFCGVVVPPPNCDDCIRSYCADGAPPISQLTADTCRQAKHSGGTCSGQCPDGTDVEIGIGRSDGGPDRDVDITCDNSVEHCVAIGGHGGGNGTATGNNAEGYGGDGVNGSPPGDGGDGTGNATNGTGGYGQGGNGGNHTGVGQGGTGGTGTGNGSGNGPGTGQGGTGGGGATGGTGGVGNGNSESGPATGTGGQGGSATTGPPGQGGQGGTGNGSSGNPNGPATGQGGRGGTGTGGGSSGGGGGSSASAGSPPYQLPSTYSGTPTNPNPGSSGSVGSSTSPGSGSTTVSINRYAGPPR